ncbi:hypothetical protein OS493_000227 [Desmophyllum pertusum]|uniref:Uncharacterized protein n=1 Tax=Desmophyllum pertusum TaxID=174260 RepID=A0A9X0A781_9CNID|nr:hypothetical protein OS493_000227 [Desmophyllum pertusum]
MQVQKAREDMQTATEKIKDYHVSHEILTPTLAFITNQPGIGDRSRYSIGLHFKSPNLQVTLNVAVVKCETYNRTGIKDGYGKLLTRKNGVNISLDYKVANSGAEKATGVLVQWITWPFKSLANKMAIMFEFWANIILKVSRWIAWPFKILVNKMVGAYDFLAGVCSSLKETIKRQLYFDDPIRLIEAVCEVIWRVCSPFYRAIAWLCKIAITVKNYIKLQTVLFVEKYPAVQEVIAICRLIWGHFVCERRGY